LPDPDENWWKYDNPFEIKFVLNKFDGELSNLFEFINSNIVVNRISTISNISNLEPDPYFHAGGLHAYPRNGICGIHLDYNLHPISFKERRVSLMIYMCKSWLDEYGGKLELWDEKLCNKKVIQCSFWNTAVLFKTNGINYHGLPDPIKCPSDMYRKCIGVYYMSDLTQETSISPRKNAVLIPTPNKIIDERLRILYDIRKTRRLTPDDMIFWPSWKKDCGLIDEDNIDGI
jgi:hypothetical protein